MDELFISGVQDDRERIERLERKLEDFGYRVWFDREPAVGKKHRDEVIQQLEKARTVVVAWSPHSTSSPWVQDEALRALKLNKCIPVLIDICAPPPPFSQVRTFDLSAALSSDSAMVRNEDWIDLATALRESMGRTAISAKKETRAMPSGNSTGVAMTAVAALVGLAVGGVGATAALRFMTPPQAAPYTIDTLPENVRDAVAKAREKRSVAHTNAKLAVERARQAQNNANSANAGLAGYVKIPDSAQQFLYMGDQISPLKKSLGLTLFSLQGSSADATSAGLTTLGERRVSYLGEHKSTSDGQSLTFSGYGVRVADDLEYLQGSFHDSVPNGPGVMQYEDRRRYEGDFRQDRQDGYAVLVSPEGDVKYEGQWQSGEQYGLGVEWSDHGCTYKAGEWGKDGLSPDGATNKTICK